MPPPILDIRQLGKVYADGTVAVRGVDLRVEDGVFGLLGENGAGKSTTLSILALQLEPTSGSVLHGGLDPARPQHRRTVRRRLGYLPQDFQPVPVLTGWEYLEHCARLRGSPRSRKALRRHVGDLLEAVELGPWAHRPSGEYSGGMKRRLGVCQALVHEPELAILDEPSAGLDPEQRILLRNFIAEQGRRRTVLLSSHVVDDVDQTCSRMAVLSAGRILYQGSPGELLRRVSAAAADRLPTAEAPPGAAPADGRRRTSLEEAYGALLASARPAGP